MSFIESVRVQSKEISGPKEKVLAEIKSEIEITSTYGYNQRMISPSEILSAMRKVMDYKDPPATQFLEYHAYILSALRREGFEVYVSEYSDKSGYFHIVKW